MIVCGTRAGVTKYRERVSRLPQHFLMAPLDADPGSMAWPVSGSPGICLVEAGAPEDFVLRLTQALLSDGAEMVVRLRDPKPASIHTRQ